MRFSHIRQLLLPLLVFLFLNGLGSWAQAEVFRGPQSSAMGGTGVAGLEGAEGALLNPALIPMHSGSGVDAYFRDGEIDLGQHWHSYGVGGLDNGPEVFFPGALHYLRLRQTGDHSEPVNSEFWQLAVGERAGEHFALGLSVQRLVQDTELGKRFTQWNYTIGSVIPINTGLGVAYVLRNLAQVGSDVPLALREEFQQTLGVYAGLGEVARVRFDVSRLERQNPDHKLDFRFGFESKTSPLMVLRMGYRYDDLTGRRLWTAGVGFDGPRLKAHYAFEKNQDRVSGALHSVDLSLPF